MERNTVREIRGARDWPMTLVLGLALLLSGMPQEITATEWGE